MSYQLVEDLQKKAYPQVAVVQACRVLEVSRSGYYAHQTATRQRLATPVVCAASVHLKAAFAASQKAYGSRRLTTEMAKRGIAMGRHMVRTLMRLNGLPPVWGVNLSTQLTQTHHGCLAQCAEHSAGRRH